MRTLSRYLVKDYLTTLGLTLAVFTFVMSLGSFIKAIDMMSRGMSAPLILRFFFLNIPFILQFTTPMSSLTATLLLFTRLSMDGEVTALKACGFSLWQIATPVLTAAAVLAMCSLALANWISPQARSAQRRLLASFADEDPMALIEEGRFVRDLPGIMLYVGRKSGGSLSDIVIYEFDARGRRRNIRAKRGRLESDPERKELRIDLYEVRIEQPHPSAPHDPSRMQSLTAEHYPKVFSFDELFRRRATERKKPSDQTLPELIQSIRTVAESFPELTPADRSRQRMRFLVEFQNRSAMSMASFAFALIGIPLGMHSRRKESSIGVALSLGMVFVLYLFMILAKALARHAAWHPDYLAWVPVLFAQVLGFVLIRRSR